MGYHLTAKAAAGPREEECATRCVRTPHAGVGSGYRYYSLELGRWINRDPADENVYDINLYGLALNNAVGLWDALGLWTEPERSTAHSRARTCNESEPYTIDRLAQMVRLDASQAFGPTGWLRSADGGAVSRVKPGSWYTVPNEAHITAGNAINAPLGDVSVFLHDMKQYVIREYESRQYRVVDHQSTASTRGQSHEDVQRILATSPHIYVWAHYGHGDWSESRFSSPGVRRRNRRAGNLSFSVAGGTDMETESRGPADFSVRYRLAEVLLFACRAGQRDEEWAELVADGGVLYATPIGIPAVTWRYWRWWDNRQPLRPYLVER